MSVMSVEFSSFWFSLAYVFVCFFLESLCSYCVSYSVGFLEAKYV